MIHGLSGLAVGMAVGMAVDNSEGVARQCKQCRVRQMFIFWLRQC